MTPMKRTLALLTALAAGGAQTMRAVRGTETTTWSHTVQVGVFP